jgi:REP element-mobilizing transposase RayT
MLHFVSHTKNKRLLLKYSIIKVCLDINVTIDSMNIQPSTMHIDSQDDRQMLLLLLLLFLSFLFLYFIDKFIDVASMYTALPFVDINRSTNNEHSHESFVCGTDYTTTIE